MLNIAVFQSGYSIKTYLQNRQTYGEREYQSTHDKDLPVMGFLGVFDIQMHRMGVHRQETE